MAIRVNGKFVAGGKGKNGKSAYDYAVDGSYTGTEAEFQALMAQAQNLDGGPFLPLNGGTMNGNINFNSKKAENLSRISFIPQGHQEIHPGEYFMILGNDYCSIITDGNFAKLFVGSPSSELHAANKKYVDESIQKAILDSWAKAY